MCSVVKVKGDLMENIIDKIREENRHASSYEIQDVKKLAALLKSTIDQIQKDPGSAVKAYGVNKDRLKDIL